MTEDSSFHDLQPRSWLDAFPWLKGVTKPESSPWWNEPTNSPDATIRRQRIAAISELAMERLTRWTIGQIFPGLPPDLELRRLQLPTRAANVLGREGCVLAADLSNVALDSMMDWRQIGVGTVDAILQALADASTSVATPMVTNDKRFSRTHSQAYDASNVPGWLASVMDDFTRIAYWYVTLGVPSQRLLEAQLPSGMPDEVAKARQRLKDLSAIDILSEDQLGLDVATLFDEALKVLDPRAVQILSERLFADEAVTLDEIGRRHNLTRERVRQIEAKARGTMLSTISENVSLANMAEATRTLIGLILPLDELLRLVPSLGKRVDSVGQPAWRLLDRLDDAYEIEDGWCVVPTMTAAREVTQTELLERADQYGVVRLDDLNLIQLNAIERRHEFLLCQA
ncbi:sigma factor-like helix-turn-helix DNA-binding protein, partial [Mycobacterium sp. MFM001]|uniref:sigma factor-like helix-turn-helix DNA-binding protein n=1 Tax=Mycobacterium sp. MFM001 TaxID=2049453 RepID=UPI0013570CE1